MFKLPLGTSITTVRPLGFKDGSYRYGIKEDLIPRLQELKKLDFYSVDVDCCALFVPSDLPIYNEGYELIKSHGLNINAIHMPMSNEWADLACQYEEDRKEILAMNPDIAAAWHPVYGDRVNKLVFIGRKMDKAAIIKALDECIAG